MIRIEDAILSLARQCDGARNRDFVGFNKADAQDGKRLAALIARNQAISPVDMERAQELLGTYAGQASKLFAKQPKSQRKLETVFRRAGSMKTNLTINMLQESSHFMLLSPYARKASIYLEPPTDIEGELWAQLQTMTRIHHGERETHVHRQGNLRFHVNHKPRRGTRFDIDYTSSSRPTLLTIADMFGIAIDPAISNPKSIDPGIDDLRRARTFAYVARSGDRDFTFVIDSHTDAADILQRLEKILPGEARYDTHTDGMIELPMNSGNVHPLLSFVQELDVPTDTHLMRLLNRIGQSTQHRPEEDNAAHAHH